MALRIFCNGVFSFLFLFLPFALLYYWLQIHILYIWLVCFLGVFRFLRLVTIWKLVVIKYLAFNIVRWCFFVANQFPYKILCFFLFFFSFFKREVGWSGRCPDIVSFVSTSRWKRCVTLQELEVLRRTELWFYCCKYRIGLSCLLSQLYVINGLFAAVCFWLTS